MSSNILLRTVHLTDSYYAKSGRRCRTPELRECRGPELQEHEGDDAASAYVLRPL